eukprot:986012-Rhodomonas_salina.2
MHTKSNSRVQFGLKAPSSIFTELLFTWGWKIAELSGSGISWYPGYPGTRVPGYRVQITRAQRRLELGMQHYPGRNS